MVEEQKPKCDVDDLLCRMRALAHLQSLRDIVGEERFQTDYPELQDLPQQLSERVAADEATVRQALERCGLGTAGTPVEPPNEEEQ